MSAVLQEPQVPVHAGAANAEHLETATSTSLHVTASGPPLTAVQRLAASRAMMKVAMEPPLRHRPERSNLPASSTGKWLNARLADLKQLPGVDVLVDGITAWWAHHPLRPVAAVVSEATDVAARPLANNNPLAMVATAAAVGALFAWTRPWRWLLRSALFAGIVPQLASRIVAKLPIESWLTMLSAALTSTRRSTAPPQSTSRTAPAASHPRFDDSSF